MGHEKAAGNASGNPLRKLYLLTGTLAAAYSMLIACSLAWNIHHEHMEQISLARIEALAIFNKDLSFRSWATKHGGVYVPTTAKTPPSPYLSQIPERDIVTPSGRRLTLMNPAYMMRQAIEEYRELYGVKGHITSLNALNPENAPDPWERKALERFNSGEKEVVEIAELDNKPYLRFMQPMITREGCLKCHAAQGYRQGDIRGGLAVSVPLASYFAFEKETRRNQAVSHLFIWLLGMTGIGFGFFKGKEGIAERTRAEKDLAERIMLAELTADIGNSLTKPSDLRSILDACADALVHHLDAAFARIWTLNTAGDILELQASAGMYTNIDGAHKQVPVGKFKIGLIAEERKPHVTNAVIGDPRVHDQEWAKREGMVAFAGHPLTIEDKLVGVMAMFSRKPLTDATVKALALVSNEIALGIERKRSEEELRKLTSAINQCPVSIVITDSQGNIEFVNPKFTQLTGYLPEEAIGQNPRILKTNETPPEVYRQLWNTITSGNEWFGEFHNRKKNGELFLESATIAPVKNSQGTITHYIAIKEDITEHRSLENQLRQAQKMEAVGTLTGGIAHDFNNILTAIIGFGSLIEIKMAKDDPLYVNVTQILAAADRAANLVRSLLAFSRKQAIEVNPVDLNEIVAGMEKMLRRLIREDIELLIHPEDEVLTVLADAGQIEQVLLNLTTNARDSLPSGGIINISTEQAELDETFRRAHGYGEPGRYALITFADNGEGMEKSVQQRIFEPFFTTKEVGKGTGLGLAVCYGIVKQHHGFIVCYSEPGRGTTFRIYLPLSLPAAKKEAASAASSVPVTGGRETILVAEDDPAVRSLTTGILTEFGYSVIEAQDGEEAVAKFIEHPDNIQLCLFDMIMPKKNGMDAYEEIRKVRPDLNVLFMSGYHTDISMKGELLRKGKNLISKPVIPRELLKKVREVLDR